MAGEYQSVMNLAGLGLSLASAIPTKQDKMQRRIAMGGEDPAVAALRRRLAAQNAQTAMSVAASQQGVNPALAQRNAQQALAQQQVQTNAELARGAMSSALAARASDAVGRRRDLGLQMGANFLNTAGTMLATQEAAAGVDPAAKAMSAGLNGGMPTAAAPATSAGSTSGALVGSNYTAPAPVTFQEDLPAPQVPVGPDGQPLFDPDAPSAAGGPPSAQFAPGAPPGSGVESLPGGLTGPQVTAPQVPSLQTQLPVANQAMPASQVMADAAAPPVVAQPGQMRPGTGAGPSGTLGPAQGAAPPATDPRTWATPQERAVQPRAALPPEMVSNPGNSIFLDMYDDAVARGDDEAARSILTLMTYAP